MKKVIVDSNIIFSALRGTDSRTRNRILNSDEQFYSPNFLIGEIFRHKERILAKSSASEEDTYEFLLKILNRIQFVNEENISIENFIFAYHLCKNVDEKDTPFVALSLELGYDIWTRDKELKTALREQGFDNFIEE